MTEDARILIVDDDEGARRTLTLVLERKGYAVETAGTVEEALTTAERRFFNVALVDIRLPDGTGIELLGPLKARHPDMELIVVTGYASTETAVRALNEGAAAYVTKPLNMEQILAELSRVLERQRLLLERRQADEEIRHLNAVLDGVRAVNRLIAREPDRERLINGVCESLVETRGYLGAWLALRNDSREVTQFTSAGMDDDAAGTEQALRRNEWPDCARCALDQRAVVVIEQDVCVGCPQARAHAARSSHHGLAAPLAHGGKTYGVLVVTADVDFAPDHELSLFGELADDVGVALHSMELEEHGRRATRALRISEERYRLLFEDAPVALWEEDFSAVKARLDQLRAQGVEDFQSYFQARPRAVAECLSLVKILDVNQAALELHQAESKEQLLSNFHAVFTERSYETFAEELSLIAAGERLFDLETTMRTLTDETCDVILRWSVLPGYEDTLSRVLSSTIDITERNRMEEQLQRQERLAAVGRFAGGIAHDFRNFLTTIILYAGMPQRRPDLDPQVERALEVISTEARQAADLLQQILDFSGSSTAAEVQPVDLVESIQEGSDILRLAVSENIRLSLALEPTEAVVEADPTRIQQVLMNLVLNARDAMPEGGDLGIALSRLTIGPDEDPPLAGMEPGPWICLTVSDTGTGMTDEVKERLFEPYFTTKEAGQGTGLGLPQVYGIVKQHRGVISVKTELGAGTAFHVYLPAYEKHQIDQEQEPTELPRGAGEMILLVEDQDALREAGRELLTDLGYGVLAAANGQEALELLQGMKVDLVITDAIMPAMGGAALMRELAQRFPRLPALAVTGDTRGLQGLQEAGFAAVLDKPFDTLALAQTVRRVLDAE